MNSLLDMEIDEMINDPFRLLRMARGLENNWIENHLDIEFKGIYKNLGKNSIPYYLERKGLRIVRQCGDKQTGPNTSLTSLYKGTDLLGTLKIKFMTEENKIWVEASC